MCVPWGFSGGSDGIESACHAGGRVLSPGLGSSPGGRHGNPLQYSCLENRHGQRSLVGYSPRGLTEWDTTERLSSSSSMCLGMFLCFCLDLFFISVFGTLNNNNTEI